jgi:NAD(P)-dependent dehydrogenase (short-subunit alcohol dehydrogenase family)
VARDREQLAAVAGDISALGGDSWADPIVADVRSVAEMTAAARRVRDVWGPPDILVIAAGVAIYREVAEMTEEEWSLNIDTNLTGAFHSVRAVLPTMLERGRGDVIAIGSVASIKAFPECGAYGASKFGLLGLTRVLREEVRHRGVRVSCILAGATDTDIWGPSPPVPPERMMPADSVAEAVVSALTADPRTVVEEILLRPALGDL